MGILLNATLVFFGLAIVLFIGFAIFAIIVGIRELHEKDSYSAFELFSYAGILVIASAILVAILVAISQGTANLG